MLTSPFPPRFAIFACVLVLTACAAAAQRDAATRRAISQGASWERVRADMAALSSDAMEGRAAGSAGYDRAAAFVAARFAELGLDPIDTVATHYCQPVEFVESRLANAALRIDSGKGSLELAFPDDFATQGGFGPVTESIAAPLSFAGYGIAAPEFGHDDYAQLDVRGRIAVVLSGAPPRFGTSERAFYSSLSGKQALAMKLGAVGLILVQTPVDRERTPWPRVVAATRRPDLRWRDADGSAHEGFAALPTVTLSPRGAERVFSANGLALDKLFQDHLAGQGRGFALGSTAAFSRTSTQRAQLSSNVVGLLAGSDARLRDEVLLISAHLDHLGTGAAGQVDSIYNGAYDNAAGVAVMLELARLLAQSRHRVQRTVVFAAFTAEEHGLRGSDHMAQHPPVPPGALVANLNVDMPYLGFPIRDVEGYGASHSTLEDALARAARENGLSVTPDPRPELVRLIRSDQYSFVRQGIPGLNLKPGAQSADPGIDGAAALRDFLARHYHEPGDDLSLPFSSEAAEAFTRTAATLALLIANDAERPRWRPDDFFGTRFGGRPQDEARPPALPPRRCDP
jgi:hypothetical protein